MNEDEERQLGELLRRALREEASRHLPAGDGLSLIQHRVRSRRRLGWARPVLVMGAVAAVAAAAALLPGAFRQQQRPDSTAAGSRPAASVTTPSAVPTGTMTVESTGSGAPPPPSPTIPPGSGVQDLRTVWPYASRAQGYYQAGADVKSGRRTELLDAGTAAVSFVRAFVGSSVKLVPGPRTSTGRGATVVVNRLYRDGSTRPVTRVSLVPVDAGPKSPWLVASADRPTLTYTDKTPAALNALVVSSPAPVRADSNQIPVAGSVYRPSKIASAESAAVKVELCDAEGVPLAFNQTYASVPVDESTFGWRTVINIDPGQLDRAVSIAAWTLDGNSDVLEFVAMPAPTVRR
jgi:hypothetical protein